MEKLSYTFDLGMNFKGQKREKRSSENQRGQHKTGIMRRSIIQLEKICTELNNVYFRY